MRRTVSMHSALIELPLREPDRFKHALRGWTTNSSGLWQPRQRAGSRMVAPGPRFLVPSGEQSRRKIGHPSRLAAKAKLGIREPRAKHPIAKLRGALQAE